MECQKFRFGKFLKSIITFKLIYIKYKKNQKLFDIGGDSPSLEPVTTDSNDKRVKLTFLDHARRQRHLLVDESYTNASDIVATLSNHFKRTDVYK